MEQQHGKRGPAFAARGARQPRPERVHRLPGAGITDPSDLLAPRRTGARRLARINHERQPAGAPAMVRVRERHPIDRPRAARGRRRRVVRRGERGGQPRGPDAARRGGRLRPAAARHRVRAG